MQKTGAKGGEIRQKRKSLSEPTQIPSYPVIEPSNPSFNLEDIAEFEKSIEIGELLQERS